MFSNFEPKSTKVNNTDGIGTLENSTVEGFSAPDNQNQPWDSTKITNFNESHYFSNMGYVSNITNDNGDINDYVKKIIDKKIKPLKEINADFSATDARINANYNSLTQNMDAYKKVLSDLNEVPQKERRIINVGVSNVNEAFYSVPNIDSSYQRIVVPEYITTDDMPGKNKNVNNANDRFKVQVAGKSLKITKVSNNGEGNMGSPGWNAANGYAPNWDPITSTGDPPGLYFNIIIEESKDKKYYHKIEDGLELGRPKSQREQHMTDTKELLLYTNQAYIIGTITTALVLIFTYRNVA
jgi:hypothetical protein